MKLELIFYKNIKNQNKLYSFKIYNKCNQNYNKKTKNSQFVIVKKSVIKITTKKQKIVNL